MWGVLLRLTKLIVCLVQRKTDLIQIFRWPDRGYSPLLPHTDNGAMNWPVWTRNLLYMKQASAALVTRCRLGNGRRGFAEKLKTEGPNFPVSIPTLWEDEEEEEEEGG